MIRRATQADVPVLVDIAQRFHHATQYARFGCSFSATKLQAVLETQIADEDACVLVAERDGAVVGVAGAVRSQLYMSEDDIAVELYWWVNPEARGGASAVRLMRGLESWARERGFKALAMSSMVPIAESPADSIYERLGYSNIEKSWIKAI